MSIRRPTPRILTKEQRRIRDRVVINAAFEAIHAATDHFEQQKRAPKHSIALLAAGKIDSAWDVVCSVAKYHAKKSADTYEEILRACQPALDGWVFFKPRQKKGNEQHYTPRTLFVGDSGQPIYGMSEPNGKLHRPFDRPWMD